MVMQELLLVEKAETVQVHSTLGGEGLKVQRKAREWKTYMKSYMAGCECMIYRNLRQAHLQEVGLTHIPAIHGSETTTNGSQGYFNIFSNHNVYKT